MQKKRGRVTGVDEADLQKKSHFGKRILMILPAVFMMICIFHFSAQPAVVSSELSGTVGYRIVAVVDDLFHCSMTKAQRLDWTEKIQFPVRKAAHMTEYGILALCIYIALWKGIFVTCLKSMRFRLVCAELVTIAYASTDEFHQLFVSGRSGQVRDVCIDGTGALIALLLFWILIHWRKN